MRKVALAYGKYRAKRAAERELGVQPRRRSGAAARTRHARATRGYPRAHFLREDRPQADARDDDLVARLLRSTSINLTAEERRDTIVLNAKSLLDLDADARFFSARILLSYIYEETLPWKVADGPQALEGSAPQGVPRLHPARHRAAPARSAARGVRSQEARRRARSVCRFAVRLHRHPDAVTIATSSTAHDTRHRPQAPARSAADLLAPRGHGPLHFGEGARDARGRSSTASTRRAARARSTPTLFNAGTMHPQLSSCYLLYCGDSIEEITETWRRFSHLSKWAGGLGCSWTAIRGAGAHIHGTNGESSGVIPFLKVSQRHRHRRESRRQAARARCAAISSCGTRTSRTSSICARKPATTAAARTT